MTRLFVEHLTVIDCAFLDAQRGLVGESWVVDLELDGELDDQGMVLDFGDVKKRLKKVIDDTADHKLVVPERSPALQLALSAAPLGFTFQADTGAIEHHSPTAAVCMLPAEQVDAESLRAHLTAVLQRTLPANVRSVTVRVRNESAPGPYYHYTHGLKKHAGHCQRIAHGHRSRLEIRVDGARDRRLEQRWVDRFRDIYVGSVADVVSHRAGRLRFEYRSAEGQFSLELPADRCELIETDSTVERIAEFIMRQVVAERPASAVEVRAYEGVLKGAIASAAPAPVV